MAPVEYEFVDSPKLHQLAVSLRVDPQGSNADLLERVVSALRRQGSVGLTRPRTFYDLRSDNPYYLETCRATKLLLRAKANGERRDVVLWYSQPIGPRPDKQTEFTEQTAYPSSLFLIQDLRTPENDYIASNCSFLTMLCRTLPEIIETESGGKLSRASRTMEVDFARRPVEMMERLGAIATRSDVWITVLYKRLTGTVWDKQAVSPEHRKGDHETCVVGYALAIADGTALYDKDDVETHRLRMLLEERFTEQKETGETLSTERRGFVRSIALALVTAILGFAAAKLGSSSSATQADVHYRCQLFILAAPDRPDLPHPIQFQVVTDGNNNRLPLLKTDSLSFTRQGKQQTLTKDLRIGFAEPTGSSPKLVVEALDVPAGVTIGYKLYRNGGGSEELVFEDRSTGGPSQTTMALTTTTLRFAR